MILTKEHLRAIAPFANDKLITALAPAINYWFPIYGMADKRVASMALGQWAEETDGFKTFREYASGAAYQGRMGNVQPGDGVKFAGMGPDMITGRNNYAKIAKETGLDLVNHPELLLKADEGVHASCQFWVDNGLIPLALAGNEHEVTHRINGGFNGESVRIGYINRAQLVITENLDIPVHVAAIGTVQPHIVPAPVNTAAAPAPIPPVAAPLQPSPLKPSVTLSKPPSIFARLWAFLTRRPVAPQGLIGETQMNIMPSKSSLNIASLIGIATSFGAVLPQIYATFGTNGLIGAAVFAACFLIQAFLPVGTASSIENVAMSAIPVVEGLDPALKPVLENILAGIKAAAANATVTTTTTTAAPAAAQ